MKMNENNSGDVAKKNPSPQILIPRETAEDRRLLFLAGSLLADHSRLLRCGGAAGFGLFLAGFLLICFRGFIAHNFDFLFCG